MASTAIVALPSVGEPVNKVSSEKKAHLTLLFLGDHELSAQAILYIQHACSELSPFGLSVDYRGTLGDDQADVLFFEKSAWDIGRVAEFRHHLLLNDEIKRAYDSADQFPEWTPHLTLGYPEAPANEEDEDRNLRYVDFDHIAVWLGDSEGPEFRLKYDDSYAAEVAMNDSSTKELVAALLETHGGKTLKQYGVKGMKWGVRNDKGHEGEAVKTKKLAKLDKQWEKENTGQAAWMKHYNAAADKMNNGGIDKINNDPRWKKAADDGILNDLDNPETQAYFKAHEDAFQQAMVQSWGAAGSNPSGTKHFQIKEVEDPETGEKYEDVFLVGVNDDVKHAEGDTEPVMRLSRDASGLITKYTPEERVLKHYGVKGMKWGVTTKDRAPQVSKQEVQIVQKKPGTFAKAKGGKGLPLSDDAKNALEARQKAKASTTDALSNKELQDLVTRMNLEKQYSQLTFETDRRSKGQRFVQGLLGKKRYGGEKRKYTDPTEELGEQARKISGAAATKVKDAMEVSANINRTDLTNIY